MTGQPFTRCATTTVVDVAPTESALYFPPLKTFKASPSCFFANATTLSTDARYDSISGHVSSSRVRSEP
jgi:hypothetical protein